LDTFEPFTQGLFISRKVFMSRISALRDLARNPLFPGIYLPAMIHSVAQMMIIPILPVYAAGFNVSYGLIGLVLAAGQIGRMVGDVPAGLLLGRLGRKPSMVIGLASTGFAILALFWAQSIPEVLVFQLLAGMGTALYGVSIHDHMSGTVTTENRGRSIAVLGGILRFGKFAGPTIGTTVAALFGLRAPFVLFAVMIAIALVIVITQYTSVKKPQYPSHASAGGGQFLTLLIENRRALALGGAGQVFVQITRAGSQAIIPLYATDVLGLSVQMIGPIFSISAALDLALFYPAGWIMDRKGRKHAIVPSFIVQAVGLALIPLTSGFLSLLFAASLIGLGNGLSAGTMMTLGADLAPVDSRGAFLGVWRLIGDMGSAGGPLIVGGVAGILALGASALVISGAGGMAASIFAFLVPETLRKQKPAKKCVAPGSS
jgi:MFS family permease